MKEALGRTDKRDVEMYKLDEYQAYRQHPIERKSRRLFYFRFLNVDKPIPKYVLEGQPVREEDLVWYEKQVLPFGFTRSVEWYVRFSKAIKALVLWEGTPHLKTFVPCDRHALARYIDDTLGICLAGWGDRSKARHLELYQLLQFSVSQEKLLSEGSVSTWKEFLGVILDGVSEEKRLSAHRVKTGWKVFVPCSHGRLSYTRNSSLSLARCRLQRGASRGA